jgi:bifunctional DNA-binding transcriptional regulator/antitoxin component of YhaV-PrlF toxin-antitoxin module
MKGKLITKLDHQGRFTIPQEIREVSDLRPFDFVSIQSGENGTVIVKKVDIASV